MSMDFTEINKLKEMLEMEKIPFTFRPLFGGYQIIYPNVENNVCDVIIHNGSYGRQQGLLEIMGLVDEEEVGDSVEGYLTATDCFNRIYKHYKEHKNDSKSISKPTTYCR